MSYEDKISDEMRRGNSLPKRLDINIVKYFWMAGPLSTFGKKSIPKFLRNVDVFKNFSDHELKILSNYLHHRTFDKGEVVFKQHDLGIGFYLIYSGQIDIVVEDIESANSIDTKYMLTLDKNDYFGELALLQENSVRSATAIAKDSAQLLGIFRPDLDDLLSHHPVVAAKLLQSITMIVANRLHAITKEVAMLKEKIKQLEVGQERGK